MSFSGSVFRCEICYVHDFGNSPKEYDLHWAKEGHKRLLTRRSQTQSNIYSMLILDTKMIVPVSSSGVPDFANP